MIFINKTFFFIFIIMKTYGIEYPFRDSGVGNYVKLTTSKQKEIRSNLVHLILTKKGTRYFMPDFGTRIYEYIFEQNDLITFNHIEDDIRESVRKYIPNLTITTISIISSEDDPDNPHVLSQDESERLFRTTSESTKPYTAKIKISYEINDGSFSQSDFVIINI